MWHGLPLVVEPTHLKEWFSDQVGSSSPKDPKLNKKNLWSFTNLVKLPFPYLLFRVFVYPTHPNQNPTGYHNQPATNSLHAGLDFHFQLLSYHLTIQEATPPWRRMWRRDHHGRRLLAAADAVSCWCGWLAADICIPNRKNESWMTMPGKMGRFQNEDS